MLRAVLVVLFGSFCALALADDDTHDCIAIARTRGAVLLVDQQVVLVPAKGMVLNNCESARFQKAAVRLHYLGKAGLPIVEQYDSTSEDDGREVSERVTITGSIGAFIRTKPNKSSTPMTGGQYSTVSSSALFTLRKAMNGETYAMVVFAPSSEYVQKTALTDLTIGASATQTITEPGTPPAGQLSKEALRLDGQACGVLWNKINCGRPSSEPGFKAFMAFDEPKDFQVGQTYSLSAKDKSMVQMVYVPPDYLKGHYQGEFAPASFGSMRLQLLLRELSIQAMLRSDDGIASAKSELVKDFPHLVNGPGGSR